MHRLEFVFLRLAFLERLPPPEPYIRRVWPVGVPTKALEWRNVKERKESAKGTRMRGERK